MTNHRHLTADHQTAMITTYGWKTILIRTCKLLFKSPIFMLYDPYIPDLAPTLKKKKERGKAPISQELIAPC